MQLAASSSNRPTDQMQQTSFSSFSVPSSNGFASQSPSFHPSTNLHSSSTRLPPALPSSIPKTSTMPYDKRRASTSSTESDPTGSKRNLTGHEVAALEGATSLGDLDDPPGGPDQRPNYAYVTLIRYAILGSPYQRLTLQEIYEAIEKRYSFYGKLASKGWKNSVRHNLSLNKCFKREIRDILSPGKGGCWVVDMDEEFSTSRQRRKKREEKRQSSIERQIAATLPFSFTSVLSDFPSLSPARPGVSIFPASFAPTAHGASYTNSSTHLGKEKALVPTWMQWSMDQSQPLSATGMRSWESVQVPVSSGTDGLRWQTT